MMSEISNCQLSTSHNTLAISEVGKGEPVLLLIHGNSFCKKIWRHILNSPLSQTHRIIAFDLPGHGESSNASNPEQDYTQPGYARAAVDLLTKLGVNEVIVFGWSLGGHIGIEMIPLAPAAGLKIRGLMIVGTPPVGYGDLDKGFTLGPKGWKASWAARDDLTPEEEQEYANVCADPPYEDWMLDCVRRTDPTARKIMFYGFDRGECLDQKKAVAETDIPIAVVNGANEPFLNLQFIRDLKFGNLWGGNCIEMPGLLHAPFWANPNEFQKILDRFVDDCSK